MKEANSEVRFAQLESKLDSLVSLLQPSGQSSQIIHDLHEPSEEHTPIDDGRQQPQENERNWPHPTPASSSGVVDFGGAPRFGNDGTIQSIVTPASTSSTLLTSPPSVNEAETFLRVFRDTMLPSFPFVHIPPSMTVHQLHRERPFFLQAIIAVVTPTTEQKMAIGAELKQYLAQRMLLEVRSDIDMLLGLLTYIAWSFDQFLNKTASLSRFVQLAMSIVFDLRLNKHEPRETQKVPFFYSQGSAESSKQDSPSGSLEGKRAVLGCFYLSGM